MFEVCLLIGNSHGKMTKTPEYNRTQKNENRDSKFKQYITVLDKEKVEVIMNGRTTSLVCSTIFHEFNKNLKKNLFHTKIKKRRSEITQNSPKK